MMPRLFWLLLGAAWFAALPAQAGLFDDKEARDAIAKQQQQIDDVAAGRKALDERIAKLEASLLTLLNQNEQMTIELSKLRGQLEVATNGLDNATKRQKDMYVDLDARLRRIEEGVGAAPGTGPVAAATEPPAQRVALSGAPPDAAETNAYEAAQTIRRSGNYTGAIVAFQNFLSKYPTSSLAPRAQYWIGDSYFNLKDYKLAAASQQKLLAQYPDSSSVPDSLLNLASAQVELGDAAAARKQLELLIGKYPTSDAAEKARKRLVSLK
jgi:tol-pal system protein YbgF